VVAAWGYFLYIGTIDPLGGINSLWPLFGISNQMLAAIALCVATTILVKSGKARYAWVTALPLAWLVTMTSWAALEKLFSPELRVGFIAKANELAAQLTSGVLPPEKIAVTQQLIFNIRVDAALTIVFLVTTWILVLDTLRISLRVLSGREHPPLTEAPHVPSQLAQEWMRD
jgi:carbon starvation protein